jgi:hypothetical protein
MTSGNVVMLYENSRLKTEVGKRITQVGYLVAKDLIDGLSQINFQINEDPFCFDHHV